ncbi:MAG: glycosyltransferase family 4 protein [Alphaproteobacteria bacterium]|nr:glycosyltransferase family 4 protein [Alphaproteobacteria bacterium]
MSVCIQYTRPASGNTDSEIFGFDVAVTNLLSAWFRYGTASQFICRPTDIPSFDHFKEMAAAAGVDAGARCIGLDPRHPEKNLQSIGCLFRPDPLTVDLMWRRQQMTGAGFATCGLVHTMSGERIARAVGDMCAAPSDGADALICPSVSIRSAVHNLWDIHADYLNHRFGGTFKCPVQTPIIPLGIDTDKFVRLTVPEKRMEQRAALGAAEDEVIILFVGRLSFATKAHPLPLFLAAERAAQVSGKKVRLVMYGYFKPRDMEPHFRNLAADLCKTVRVEFVTNDDARFPDGLWAGADIFASLSDNVQESFGLTPIEAMAAGLPAVISDWDGYREGVRNGIDGYRVPTVTPQPEAGMDIAAFYYNEENYGVALSGAVQSTGIDIEYCTHAFNLLIGDAEKRREMGNSGRARAQGVFDWKHIIRAYEELWESLADRRRNAPPPRAVPPNWQAVHPAYPNPWQMFADFPSMHLAPADILRVVMNADEVETILRHEMNYFVPDLLLPKDGMRQLVSAIREAGSARVADIFEPFPSSQRNRLQRCLGWMLKHGVCVMIRAQA